MNSPRMFARAGWTRVTFGIAVATIGVLIAAVTGAVFDRPSASLDRTGLRICQTFGQPGLVQYGQTATGIGNLRTQADQLSGSSHWHALGVELGRLARLGPSSTWASSERTAFRRDFAGIRAGCAGRLPGSP
jgi:hypothetical protein